MRARLGVVVFGVAVACGRGGGGGERTAPRDRVDDAGLRHHMDDHVAVVSGLQEALMRGQGERVREQARYLVEHAGTPALAEWKPYVEAMAAAARQVMDAPDLVTAAGLVANLGLQCRRCHVERRATVAFQWRPAPPAGEALAARMARHGWGAARMWEGLVGPSDELWKLGAREMGRGELRALVPAGAAGDVDELIERIAELADQALVADTPEAETALQGNLAAACVRCHQVVREAAPEVQP